MGVGTATIDRRMEWLPDGDLIASGIECGGASRYKVDDSYSALGFEAGETIVESPFTPQRAYTGDRTVPYQKSLTCRTFSCQHHESSVGG